MFFFNECQFKFKFKQILSYIKDNKLLDLNTQMIEIIEYEKVQIKID
jgi:hypothetical protein